MPRSTDEYDELYKKANEEFDKIFKPKGLDHYKTEVKLKAEEVQIDNEHQAARFNSNKPRMSLLPHDALVEVTKVFMFGAEKYDDHNWRKGLPFTDVIDCIERHVGAFKNGEDLDQESKLHHIAHATANTLFLLQYIHDGLTQFDNRYKKNV